MTITVLQLSDVHFTRDPAGEVSGAHPDDRLAVVLGAWQATEQQADLILLSGDNTDDGSREANTRLAAALRVLDAPILAIPGNHDDPRLVADCFGDAVVAELENWRIIGLDSTLPQQVHGTIDVASTAELLDALDDRPTIIAIHHPPLSRSSHRWFRLDGAGDFLDVLAERPHVRAVLSGHLHDAFDFEGRGALALLGCPSTLMAISHDGDSFKIGANSPTGARVLHLGDDATFSSTVLVA